LCLKGKTQNSRITSWTWQVYKAYCAVVNSIKAWHMHVGNTIMKTINFYNYYILIIITKQKGGKPLKKKITNIFYLQLHSWKDYLEIKHVIIFSKTELLILHGTGSKCWHLQKGLQYILMRSPLHHSPLSLLPPCWNSFNSPVLFNSFQNVSLCLVPTQF
jgi:hypothetical protein